MDIGIGLPAMVPGVEGHEVLEWARRAEQHGFSTLAVLDRLVYSNYEPLITLAAVAAVTKRIRLATTVLIAAYRDNVALLAKQAATVDHLSHGRLVLGLAAGFRADDFEASGTAYAERGRRLDVMVAQMKRIWAGASRGYAYPIGPRPPQGAPFLVFGGHSNDALRRAARYGQGWIAGGSSRLGYEVNLQRAQAAWAAHGRIDTPRMLALAYFVLGPKARERAERYLRDYYAFISSYADLVISKALTDEQELRNTIDWYKAAGCDELILFPCCADPEQVDLLAKAAL